MATIDGLRRSGRLLIAIASAAGGLVACSHGGSGTTSAANGTPGVTATQSASTTQAGAEPCTFSGAADSAQGNADAPTRLLTDVRVGVHDCYERVTFEFKPRPGDAGGAVGWKAAYEPGPITEDASGRTVPVKGAAYLVVHMSAQSADLTKENAPESASDTRPAAFHKRQVCGCRGRCRSDRASFRSRPNTRPAPSYPRR